MPLPEALRRMAWRGYRAAEQRLHELRSLTWEATRRCNLACLHCAGGCNPAADTAAELSTAEVRALFDSIAQDFDVRKVSVAITGGEPLTRRDLFQLTAHLQRLGLAWAVSTNGTLLNAHTIAALRDTGCGGISVSLDGLQAQHDAVRGRGAFHRALTGLGALKAAQFTGVTEITTCLSATAVRELDELHALVRAQGVQRWRLQPLAPVGRMAGSSRLAPGPAELRRALDWLVERRRAAEPGLEIVFDEAGYVGRGYERKVRDGFFFCGAGITGAVVHADGSVNGCIFLSPGFTQGNIRERRFSELWAQEFKPLRDRRWMRQGQCAGCADYNDCQGGCLLYRDSPDSNGPCFCLAHMINTQESK